CRKLAFSSRFYQRFKCKAANHVYKRLRLKFFFNSSSSRCCPEPFFIMKNACKTFSKCSDGHNTENRMFLPSLSHIGMTIHTSDLSHPWKQKIC
ncbi:unnamed protein product, partial [Staurois parvus]